MKWENRDINVEKWANIPKFSKLEDIATSVRLLELFFDDVLVDMVLVLATPSCTAIKRKQTLDLTLLTKKYCLPYFL